MEHVLQLHLMSTRGHVTLVLLTHLMDIWEYVTYLAPLKRLFCTKDSATHLVLLKHLMGT